MAEKGRRERPALGPLVAATHQADSWPHSACAVLAVWAPLLLRTVVVQQSLAPAGQNTGRSTHRVHNSASLSPPVAATLVRLPPCSAAGRTSAPPMAAAPVPARRYNRAADALHRYCGRRSSDRSWKTDRASHAPQSAARCRSPPRLVGLAWDARPNV